MLLSDCDIRSELDKGNLVIENMVDGAIGPASVDLMLSPYLWVFDDRGQAASAIDPREDQSGVGRAVTIDRGLYWWLHPGEVVLASTVERFSFPSYLAGRLEGKSSLGRLGLTTHVTAGFFDPGFDGYPTLEIVNLRQRPFILVPGMPIAQMSIFAMQSSSAVPYDEKTTSKYSGQGACPAPSKYHLNFNREH